MIKLFGFGPGFGVADPSAFVLKLDAYMRMAGIEFELLPGNFKDAPKGKIPYMEDGDNIIADSFFILEHLKKKYNKPLDKALSDQQKAISNLIIKSLDENFYWCIIYSRWMREDTWPIMKEALFGHMSSPARHIVPFVARQRITTRFLKHGMGMHNDPEIMEIAKNTLESLSIILAEQEYFFGESPTTIDAAAYAFLAQVTISSVDNPLNRMAKEFDNLVGYCKRIRDRYYIEGKNSS